MTQPYFLRQIFNLRHHSPLWFQALLILLALELFAVLLAPRLIPASWYLQWYLPQASLTSTEAFLKHENFSIPDPVAGWRNRPNVARKNWLIDRHGSRATHEFNAIPQKPVRVLFLGSSMINGGEAVTNRETLSAYLEDAQIEALNFGSMLYSLDQSLLAYQHRLHQFNANVVVVGISFNPTPGLQNMYIPLRSPDEVNLPYLKPRFVLDSGELRHIEIDLDMLKDIPDQPDLLAFLQQYDGFYPEFQRYQMTGMTPVAYSVSYVASKASNFLDDFTPIADDSSLLVALMRKMQTVTAEHGAQVIFLSMPHRQHYAPGRLQRLRPNRYQQRVDYLASLDLPVLDAGVVFRRHALGADKYYNEDQIHFTATANRLLAEALREDIQQFNLSSVVQP